MAGAVAMLMDIFANGFGLVVAFQRRTCREPIGQRFL